ncbi:MAG: hypothetical protein Q9196_003331 [Gyalolechia fulgens]
MTTSPLVNGLDPIVNTAKTSPLSHGPRHLKPEKEPFRPQEQLSNTDHKEKHLELPPEILEQILYLTDPESFASLVLVNRSWRAASQTPHLYAHHLSRCPCFSITHGFITGPFTEDSLPRLKKQFVREVKRNLFEAYLRPRKTVVKLTSSTTSCSASFPGGEAFDFAFSPNGAWTLALSSSRVYVLDTASSPVSVTRELKVRRRPVSAAILDDGSTLAVLSIDRKVNVYDLTNSRVKHLRGISLDNPPHTITLSPKSEVLAAAYDGGIELHSLAPNALETDRRSIKCDYVDSLKFSKDGTVLLGTTHQRLNPSTVVLSAPFGDETNQELPASDVLSHMWTSQILFPNSSRDCSHATLLPDQAEGNASWTFTYDRVFESFRAVRTDDLRNGTTYFTGPRRHRRNSSRPAKTKLAPCTLPATTDHGDLVAAGFLGKEIWLYGVPDGLDTINVPADDDSSNSTRSNSAASSGRSSDLKKLPQWHVLVDKNRNVLVQGRKVAEVPGVTGVKWVDHRQSEKGSRSVAERLLVSAPGGVSGPLDIDIEQDDFASVDGGRLIILDFDRGVGDGEVEELNFEVGHAMPELLEEKDMDIEAEVDIIRRRTTRQRIGARAGTSVADALASALELPLPADIKASVPPANPPADSADDPLVPVIRDRDQDHVPASPVEGLSLEEASQVFDGPYSHTQPRSRTSLFRSATAVAANRQRNPPRITLPDNGRVQYRRPDGRGELSHESDADNWVPPPPLYTPKAERPLPEHLEQSLMPRQDAFERRGSDGVERLRRASTMYESPSSASSSRRIVSSLESSINVPRRSDTVSPLYLDQPSTSSRLSSVAEPVSPTSTMRLSFPNRNSETSHSSMHTSPAGPNRRSVSAFMGRFRPGHPKSATSLLTSPISPRSASEANNRSLSGSVRSVSLPSSPLRTRFETHRPLNRPTLSGANLQSRLQYPLPPAPESRGNTTLTGPGTSDEPRAFQRSQRLNPTDDVAAVPDLPSAEQLANLHNRYGHTPSPTHNPPMPSAVRISMEENNARPPRAALGAAGSPASPITERRRLSMAERNSFAASSPALFRPTVHRLDTIQSISSVLSQQRTRSRSRERGGGRLRRRSRSAGPNPRREHSEGNRKWFGVKRSTTALVASSAMPGGGGGSAYLENSRIWNEQYGVDVSGDKEKNGKCLVM